MATKKKQVASQRKQKTKAHKKDSPAASKKVPIESSDDHVRLLHSANAVSISYSDPAQVLPHLLHLASSFAGEHFDQANFTAADGDVLGTPAARQIVGKC